MKTILLHIRADNGMESRLQAAFDLSRATGAHISCLQIAPLPELHKLLLCDPQTSGGLLVAVTPEGEAEFLTVAAELGLNLAPIGRLVERQRYAVEVL